MIGSRTYNTELREPRPKGNISALSRAGESVANSRALVTTFLVVGIELLAEKGSSVKSEPSLPWEDLK